MNTNSTIRSRSSPDCMCCGARGQPLYVGLRDRLFEADGTWSISRCPRAECGLLWLDPMPLVEDIHKAYASYYTHALPRIDGGLLRRLSNSAKRGYLINHYGYEGDGGAALRVLGFLPWLYPGRTAELDFSVMWLAAGDRGRLLDVGAGSGWLVEHMNRLGWRAEGLDFDTQSVASARGRGLLFHQGGLPQQNFPDASFDAVTMSHCIEHVHDPDTWLSEARRILKPAGRLALATPNSASFCHARFGASWFALDPPRHLHLFNRASMTTMMRRAGFSRFRIFTSIRDANGAFIGSRAIRACGSFDMLRPPGVMNRLVGRGFQMIEAVVKLAARDAGEDLIVLADRDS